MFAVTKEKGQCMANPDVCKTPTPAGTVPTPYPNIAVPMMANPVAMKVMISGMPALNKSSKINISNGNQPGSAGGVVSNKIMGLCEFVVASQSVKFEGHPAVRLGDTTKQNDGNAVGSVVQPSQAVVMVMS